MEPSSIPSFGWDIDGDGIGWEESATARKVPREQRRKKKRNMCTFGRNEHRPSKALARFFVFFNLLQDFFFQ